MDEVGAAILKRLLFPEALHAILEEVEGSDRLIKSVLRELAANDQVLVAAWDARHGKWVPTRIYDSDKLEQYRFTASAKGLRSLGLV